MKTEVIVDPKLKLKNPLMIVGLTGIGNVGKTAVSYLIDHLKATECGEIYSPHFPHITILNEDGEMEVLKNELYYVRGKRDILFLTGHTQSISPEGHYDIVYAVLDAVKKLGVKDIVTIGGFGSGELVEDPRVLGIVSDKKMQKQYSKASIEFDHGIGEVIGASGLFVGIGKRYGMNGLCLLGETPGFLLSDPKATEEVLKVLESILGIKIDYSNLNQKIGELEKVIKKIQELQEQVIHPSGSVSGTKSEKNLTYIG